MFKGYIVDQSLENNLLIKNFNITHTEVVENWTIYSVISEEGEIYNLAYNIKKGPWYAHFWNESKIIVVFRNKIFSLGINEKRDELVEYGKSLGIPNEQLDFLTD